MDILSDTGHANLQPYLAQVVADLRQHWTAPPPARAAGPAAGQVAEPAAGPVAGPMEAALSLTISPDGHLHAVHLDSPSPSQRFDKAAWAAVTTTTFPPLPAALADPNLRLRIHFLAH